MTGSNFINPLWRDKDEGRHPETTTEWWAVEADFKTEDGHAYSIKSALTEWVQPDEQGSIFNMTLFDLRNDFFETYRKIRPDFFKRPTKDPHHIIFEETSIKGIHPHYEIQFADPDHDTIIKFQLTSKSAPYWVSQQVTGGWLPLGLGRYRYGFIPLMELAGTFERHGETQTITGIGYYEHVWGDFSFKKPNLTTLANLGASFSTYARLLLWFLAHQKPKIPQTLKFFSENNPLGYDWAWAVLDNNWVVYYGNIMLFLAEGPVAGTLILSKDGKSYKEFGKVSFVYHHVNHNAEYDFSYPTDFTLIAEDEEEVIQLRFTMTQKPREYISIFKKPFLKWYALTICESPGVITGHATTKDGEKTDLHGFCKIEPQRQLSRFGHNSLTFKITKPPKGIGLDICLDSHFLKKKINVSFHLLPKIHIKCSKEDYNPPSINI